QVVGAMEKGAESLPFLYDDGNLSPIARRGIASDINDHGHIVGVHALAGEQQEPFLWVEGELSAIPCNGRPFAINNNDQIVGSAYFTLANTGATYPFYYDPSPPVPTLWPGGPEVPEGSPGVVTGSPGVVRPRPVQAPDLEHLVQLQPGVHLAVHDINDFGVIGGTLGYAEGDDLGADGVLLIPPDNPHQQFGPTIAVIAATMLFGKGGDGGG